MICPLSAKKTEELCHDTVHGTNVNFDKIDIGMAKKYKDFGQGFYLTDIMSQAQELAEKRALLFGGTPIVQEYEFDETIISSFDINV